MPQDLFSKRQRIIEGNVPDIYTYEHLPERLKIQIIYLFERMLNFIKYDDRKEEFYKFVAEILREERGVFSLAEGKVRVEYGWQWSFYEEVKNYFLMEKDAYQSLDVVELFFKLTRKPMYSNSNISKWEKHFLYIANELNARFREHGLGYSFENDRIVRIDNEFIHYEVIKPALVLVHDPLYYSAEEEYLRAHDKYKRGEFKECLVDCLKSFESTMKIIAHNRNWSYKETDNASKLIECLMAHELLPKYLQTHFNALQSCLQSSIPTVRNKAGGHGQGAIAKPTPAYLARYLLAETAAAIRLMIEAERSLPTVAKNT